MSLINLSSLSLILKYLSIGGFSGGVVLVSILPGLRTRLAGQLSQADGVGQWQTRTELRAFAVIKCLLPLCVFIVIEA